MSILAALGPADGAVHRVFDCRSCIGKFDDMVKHHRDIGAKVLLDLDADLGRQIDQRSVDVRAKFSALFGDLCQLRQGKDLEAAAVGQHGFVPAHEFWQAAHLLDDVRTGPQVQVIGVTKNDLSTGLVQQSGR